MKIGIYKLDIEKFDEVITEKLNENMKIGKVNDSDTDLTLQIEKIKALSFNEGIRFVFEAMEECKAE